MLTPKEGTRPHPVSRPKHCAAALIEQQNGEIAKQLAGKLIAMPEVHSGDNRACVCSWIEATACSQRNQVIDSAMECNTNPGMRRCLCSAERVQRAKRRCDLGGDRPAPWRALEGLG